MSHFYVFGFPQTFGRQYAYGKARADGDEIIAVVRRDARKSPKTIPDDFRIFHVAGVDDIESVDFDKEFKYVAVIHPISEIMFDDMELSFGCVGIILTEHFIETGVTFPVKHIGDIVKCTIESGPGNS